MPLRVRTSRANKPELLVMMTLEQWRPWLMEPRRPFRCFRCEERRIRRVKRRDIKSGVWPECHRPAAHNPR